MLRLQQGKDSEQVFVMSTATSTKLALGIGCMLLILAALLILPARARPNPAAAPHTQEVSNRVNPFLVGGVMVVLVIGGAMLPLVAIHTGRRTPQPTPPGRHKIIPFPVQARVSERQARLTHLR